ncbi:hypothetical protein ACMYYO_08775 [Dermacoccaceae bacterium W4C1]
MSSESQDPQHGSDSGDRWRRANRSPESGAGDQNSSSRSEGAARSQDREGPDGRRASGRNDDRRSAGRDERGYSGGGRDSNQNRGGQGRGGSGERGYQGNRAGGRGRGGDRGFGQGRGRPDRRDGGGYGRGESRGGDSRGQRSYGQGSYGRDRDGDRRGGYGRDRDGESRGQRPSGQGSYGRRGDGYRDSGGQRRYGQGSYGRERDGDRRVGYGRDRDGDRGRSGGREERGYGRGQGGFGRGRDGDRREGGFGRGRDGDRREGGHSFGRDGAAGRGERRDGGRGYGQDRDGREARGGFGREGSPDQRRGPRSWERRTDDAPRLRDPEVPEEITGKELDRSVWQQLRTLSKENAEGVARHLAASALLLDEDPALALRHAQAAVRRAGRVPAAREAHGLVLYRNGDFAEALREFRTARRLSGSDHLLPYMVDCERGLGRLDRALELAASPEAARLPEADNIELAIVVSGVRRDLGQADAAVIGLRIPALDKAGRQPWAARLLYAYADALLDTGDEDGAHAWFSKALAADTEGETDAGERVALLEGLVFVDAEGDEDEESQFADAGPDGEAVADGDAVAGEQAPRVATVDRSDTPAGSDPGAQTDSDAAAAPQGDDATSATASGQFSSATDGSAAGGSQRSVASAPTDSTGSPFGLRFEEPSADQSPEDDAAAEAAQSPRDAGSDDAPSA